MIGEGVGALLGPSVIQGRGLDSVEIRNHPPLQTQTHNSGASLPSGHQRSRGEMQK